MKKTLFMITSSLLSVPILNAQDMVYERIAYNFLNDRELEVTSLPDNEKYTGEVHIPHAITIGEEEDLPVVGETENTNDNSPADNTPVTYYVVKIGEGAFKDCTDLTRLEMPNSVRVIDVEAIAGCTGIISLTIPNNLDKICDSAFENSHFGSLAINSGLREIGNRVFYGVVANDIILSSSCLTKYGEDLFTDSKITRILLPSNLKVIPENTFKGCEDLTYIGFNEALEEIGNNAFAGCKSLRALSLPENLVKVADNAFSGVNINSISFNGPVATEYSLSAICGDRVPSLVVFPEAYEEDFREWCPEMFAGKVSLCIIGDFSPYLPKWIYPGVINNDNVSGNLPYGVAAYCREDTDIFIDKGESVSVCMPRTVGAGYEIKVDGNKADVEIIDTVLDSFYDRDQFVSYVGESTLLTLENIEKGYTIEVDHNGMNGVYDLTESKDTITYDANSGLLRCRNEVITIYDCSGRRLASARSYVETTDLTPGIYVVKTRGAAIKIVIR